MSYAESVRMQNGVVNIGDWILHEGEYRKVTTWVRPEEDAIEYQFLGDQGNRDTVTMTSGALVNVRHVYCRHGHRECKSQPVAVEYINLTPHVVTVLDENGALKSEYPPDGRVARLETSIQCGTDGVRSLRIEGPSRLPYPRPGVGYIVSLAYAASEVADRWDLYVPHDQIRDAAGAVIGCRELIPVERVR